MAAESACSVLFAAKTNRPRQKPRAYRISCLLRLPQLLADFNVQPLDLLVERRQRDPEALRGLRLVPVALLQHVGDDPPLAFLHHLEQGGVGAMLEHLEARASTDNVVRQ